MASMIRIEGNPVLTEVQLVPRVDTLDYLLVCSPEQFRNAHFIANSVEQLVSERLEKEGIPLKYVNISYKIEAKCGVKKHEWLLITREGIYYSSGEGI